MAEPTLGEQVALLHERLGTLADNVKMVADVVAVDQEAEADTASVGAKAVGNTRRLTNAIIGLMVALLTGGSVGGYRLFERVVAAEEAAQQVPQEVRAQAASLAETNAGRLDEVEGQVERVGSELLRKGDETDEFMLYLSDKIDKIDKRAADVEAPPSVKAKRATAEAKRQAERLESLLNGGGNDDRSP